jgi:hypothetical protein
VTPGGVRRYLKGFAKRVVLCSLFVLVCKTVWPHLQPVIWPDTPLKVSTKNEILSQNSSIVGSYTALRVIRKRTELYWNDPSGR